MKKISIIIVTFNSRKYLPDFIESILKQTYFDGKEEVADILVVDNGSSDKTVDFIRGNYPFVKILRNVNNIGLCRAWNQGILMTRGEYVLMMNPDLILDKDFLHEAMQTIEEDELVGSVGGKLYRLLADHMEDIFILEKTNILDCCGIQGFENRRFVDRGAGEIDKGQYDKIEEVFGISGALVLFRRLALEKVCFNNEYFDADFFMYKEDVDLAWRMRVVGWKAIYNYRAKAFHHRQAISISGGMMAIIKNRRSRADFINYHSYKNHLMMLYKNESAGNFLRHFIFIFWYELKKILYMLIFETRSFFRSLAFIFKVRGKLRKKRVWLRELTVAKEEAIRQWFE